VQFDMGWGDGSEICGSSRWGGSFGEVSELLGTSSFALPSASLTYKSSRAASKDGSGWKVWDTYSISRTKPTFILNILMLRGRAIPSRIRQNTFRG
jgi:hypothetical protein